MNILDALTNMEIDVDRDIERGITVEKDFDDNVEKMELNKLVNEIIIHLGYLHKVTASLAPLNIRDIENMDYVKYDEILEAMSKEVDVYNRIYDEVERRVNKFLNQKGGFITDEEKQRFKEKESKNITDHIMLSFLNNRISNLRKKVDVLKGFINNDLKSMKMVQKHLGNVPIDIDRIYELIDNTNIDISLKEKLKKQVRLYYEEKENILKEKEKEREERLQNEQLNRIIADEEIDEELEEDTFEPRLFSINNYEAINELITRYEELFPNDLISTKIEEIFNYEDLNQIINFSFIDIDDEVFVNVFVTLLYKIDHTNNQNELNSYTNKLELLCNKYELYNKYINIKDQIKEVSIIPNLTDEENSILNTFKDRLKHINTSANLDLLLPILENMRLTLYSIKMNSQTRDINGERIEIKGFVLFDYREENGLKESYVISDLDENNSKNYIDSSIEREKIISNGYVDFNELIGDIILHGNAEIALQPSDKMSKFVKPVFYSDGYHKIKSTKMSNASGLYRIRPRITSYVRFFDEKNLFVPNTPKFEQIKNLLEEKIPGIMIGVDKPFVLFINYLDAFKKKDTDSYTVVKRRQQSSVIREALKSDSELYSPEELEIISQAIDVTLKSFEQLKKINNNFDFEIINKVTKQIGKEI